MGASEDVPVPGTQIRAQWGLWKVKRKSLQGGVELVQPRNPDSTAAFPARLAGHTQRLWEARECLRGRQDVPVFLKKQRPAEGRSGVKHLAGLLLKTFPKLWKAWGRR